ncbi:MAG: hypothetical protein JNM62_10780 [Flavobacteriales bacterium]|nr:hypothetical protein [Flavobacteriales bacterium]
MCTTRFRGLLLSALVGTIGVLPAQDLVVRSDGDSVNCRIKGADAKGIHFVYLYKGQLDRVYLPNNEVKYFQKKFYAASFSGGKSIQELRGYPYFRVSASFGVGRLFGKIPKTDPDWLISHQRQLRHGPFFAVEAHLMAGEHLSVGVQYGEMHYDATTNDVPFLTADLTTVTGVLRNDIRVTFIGPSVAYYERSVSGKWVGLISASVGAMTFKDDAIYAEPVHLSGETYGLRIATGVEYKIHPRLGLGFFLSETLAGLIRMEAEEDPSGFNLLGTSRVSLNRFEGGVTLNFSY